MGADRETAFAVWRQDGPEADARVVQARSADHAAEQRAREDHQDPSWRSPAAYRVRDGSTGRIWDVTVVVAACWAKAPELVEGIRQIGSDR